VAALGLGFADAATVTIPRARGGRRVATFDADLAGEEGLTIAPS
jgi:hypothetical protein